MESFQTRNQTYVPCIGRQILTTGPAGSPISSILKVSRKSHDEDFPGGPVAKNLPAKAGFDPWFGKERHATALLNSLATTTKPTLKSLCPQQDKPSRHSDVCAPRGEQPHSLQVEKTFRQQPTPSATKNNLKFWLKKITH